MKVLMTVLGRLVGIFIDTFGITHPSPEERDRATRYIASLLLLVVVLICTVLAIAMYTPRK